MANNLKKFTTEAEYTAATLNYPAVSWVTSGDTVHFDKTAPAPVNHKIKIAFSTTTGATGTNAAVPADAELLQNVNSVTVNGVPITPGGSDITFPLTDNTDYLVEYDLMANLTDVSDWFNEIYIPTGDKFDILFPAQVSTVTSISIGINNLILENTTPISYEAAGSDLGDVIGIFVPTEAVNTYKTTSGWDEFANIIQPISDYQGNIPV